MDDARSWHDGVTFLLYNESQPVASDPSVQSRHWGRDQEYDRYGLHLRLTVSDPQGPGNIASVTVTAPVSGTVYSLYDDGQHSDNGANDGYYGYDAWDLTEAPQTGNYVFTVTDANANTGTASYMLDYVIDIPRNIQPANNSLVISATPTLSWNEVSGANDYYVLVHDGGSTDICLEMVLPVHQLCIMMMHQASHSRRVRCTTLGCMQF